MTGEIGAGERGAGEGSRRHHVLFAALVAAGALVASAIFANDWLQRDWLAKKWLYRSPDGLVWLGAYAGLACASLAWLLVTWMQSRWTSTSYAPLRWTLPVVAVAWMLTWRIEPPTLVYDAQLAVCGAIAAWCVLVALSARASAFGRSRAFRMADLVVCELAACLLLTEVALRIVRRTTDTSWLATASTSPAAWVRAHRLAPGGYHLGFRANREGFVDVDPDVVLQKPRRVVCIGDSFTVGVVPYHLHYTTLAERSFEDLGIYNAGVVNSGPREYLEVLRASGLPLRPDLVVIALFLGNDVGDAQKSRPDLTTTLTDRNEVLVLRVLRRMLAVQGERGGGGTIADAGASTATTGLMTDVELSPAEAERQMPWLADPFQERPGVSESRFMYVESTRTGILRPDAQEGYRPAFEYLEQIRELARPAPLACLLIPDEYQVEDALWAALSSQMSLDGLDRDQPQRLVSAWLDSKGIPYVDLLPRLRAVPALKDGKHHVYHLQDTHLNARGNQVAAEALVELIERAGVAKRTDTR